MHFSFIGGAWKFFAVNFKGFITGEVHRGRKHFAGEFTVFIEAAAENIIDFESKIMLTIPQFESDGVSF